MTNRLPWQYGNRPQHFTATTAEGLAEIWWKAADSSPEGWRYRIEAGATVAQGNAESKQDAADRANAAWPDTLRQEQARVAKIKARERLEQQIDDCMVARSVDVMAFGIATSDYQRLIDILDYLRRKRWLQGPLAPLAEAVSAELYRRRVGG